MNYLTILLFSNLYHYLFLAFFSFHSVSHYFLLLWVEFGLTNSLGWAHRNSKKKVKKWKIKKRKKSPNVQKIHFLYWKDIFFHVFTPQICICLLQFSLWNTFLCFFLRFLQTVKCKWSSNEKGSEYIYICRKCFHHLQPANIK